MKLYILGLLFMISITSCSDRYDTVLYDSDQFQLEIPKNWQLIKEENVLLYAVERAKDKLLPPNFSLLSLFSTKDLLRDISINCKKNCLKGFCKESSIKHLKINGIDCYRSFQILVVNKIEVVVSQYYFQTPRGIYLLSFYAAKDDYEKMKVLFNQVVYSFTVKV